MTRTRVWLALESAALAVASTALAVVFEPPARAQIQAPPALVDLHGPQDFTRQFNDDRGHMRLVLLLSPT
jgi:hypothetical protein